MTLQKSIEKEIKAFVKDRTAKGNDPNQMG